MKKPNDFNMNFYPYATGCPGEYSDPDDSCGAMMFIPDKPFLTGSGKDIVGATGENLHLVGHPGLDQIEERHSDQFTVFQTDFDNLDSTGIHICSLPGQEC
jgi:hypothetical protein